MELVQRKTMEFDRKIFRRNLRESIAAAVVTALFTWMAFHALNGFERTGLLIVAASGLWIIFFLLRYGRASKPADSAQDLCVYRQALVERYDQQIGLLKSVKYWYLLPPWIGLMLNTAGLMLNHVHKGTPIWPDFVAPAIFTAVFAFVWWLNEGYAVPKLRAIRDRALALAEDAVQPGMAR
ncbi:MAG: hypothetical protein WCF17_12415 [Terracidiphilus sp.]